MFWGRNDNRNDTSWSACTTMEDRWGDALRHPKASSGRVCTRADTAAKVASRIAIFILSFSICVEDSGSQILQAFLSTHFFPPPGCLTAHPGVTLSHSLPQFCDRTFSSHFPTWSSFKSCFVHVGPKLQFNECIVYNVGKFWRKYAKPQLQRSTPVLCRTCICHSRHCPSANPKGQCFRSVSSRWKAWIKIPKFYIQYWSKGTDSALEDWILRLVVCNNVMCLCLLFSQNWYLAFHCLFDDWVREYFSITINNREYLPSFVRHLLFSTPENYTYTPVSMSNYCFHLQLYLLVLPYFFSDWHTNHIFRQLRITILLLCCASSNPGIRGHRGALHRAIGFAKWHVYAR